MDVHGAGASDHTMEVDGAELVELDATFKKKKKKEEVRHVWPPELGMPAAPRIAPSFTMDRFPSEPRFGDCLESPEDTRPLPNIHFRNGCAAQLEAKGQGEALSPRQQLPGDFIFFFIRVKFQRVSFPFPPGISAKRYLLKARVVPGEQIALATVPFDPKHVIGLIYFNYYYS